MTKPFTKKQIALAVSCALTLGIVSGTATGHTDRLGSTVYNQRLSEQRVAAVQSYLVSRGIESKRTYTEAKGETQPVTKAGQCNGAVTAELIACLQPDRRVEIEVAGTRIVK